MCGNAKGLTKRVIEPVTGDRDCGSFDFVGQPSEVLEGPSAIANLRECFSESLAVVVGFDGR